MIGQLAHGLMQQTWDLAMIQSVEFAMAYDEDAVDPQASAYRPPQKAALPRRRSTHTADLGIHINSVSSTGIDSGQEAGTAAESTWASVAIRPDGFAHSPVRYAVTSRDMQEERALKECTFAPRLNPSNTAKSIVAQTWKSMLAAYQRQHDLQAVSHGLNASQEGICLKEGSVDETVNAAVLHARDGKSSVPSDTHKGTQSSQYQTASDVRQNSSLRRALSRRHCHNSYAVAARKGRGGAAAVCSAVPVGAMQQQPYVGRTGSCAESEAQLQADVAACDKRLEQCMAASQIKRLSQKGLRGCPGVAAAGGAGHQKDNLSNHSSGGQLQQSALKIVIEAELADGSASKFEVQEVRLSPVIGDYTSPAHLSVFCEGLQVSYYLGPCTNASN